MNTGGWQWVGTVVPKHLQRHTAESTEVPLHMAMGISTGRLPQHMVPLWVEHHGCFVSYAKLRRWNLPRRQAGLRKNNGSTWRRRMRISLTFPQISALCSSVCVPHRNNRAARDSPQEVWEATHLGTYAQLREEGFFLFPYSEADKYVVFSCLFLRHLKGEGIKQEEILEDKYKVALHTRSVYFLLHISIFHLLHPHK